MCSTYLLLRDSIKVMTLVCLFTLLLLSFALSGAHSVLIALIGTSVQPVLIPTLNCGVYFCPQMCHDNCEMWNGMSRSFGRASCFVWLHFRSGCRRGCGSVIGCQYAIHSTITHTAVPTFFISRCLATASNDGPSSPFFADS
jgi:hypothetical protein